MDSPRASKRRKLDTPSRSSPQAAKASSGKATPQSTVKSTPSGRSKAAQEHSSPVPNGSRSTRSKPRESPAPLSALEKLRAKKAAQNGHRNDVPADDAAKENATPYKAKSTGSFFAQFVKPKADGISAATVATSVDNTPKKPSEIHAGQQASAGGRSSARSKTSQAIGEEEGRPREKPLEGQPRTNGSHATPGRKKTFEDEIRELEEAARQEAEADEEGSETPAKRASGRRATPKHRDAVVNGKSASDKGKSSRAKDSPAIRRVSPMPEPEPEPEAGDFMEVDESEEGERSPTPLPRVSSPVPQAAPTTPSKRTPAKVGKRQPPAIKVASFASDQIQLLQTLVLEQINGKRPVPLANVTEEYTKLNTLITQTITAGESNSMLLIGARGSGKTALLNQILREQAVDRADDFHVVRLNGFIHTDDKIALREIWRQLGREMDLDEEENTARNYADTLTTLLALLSHPTEIGQEDAGGQMTKSVIFILDEFELFASHPRQTLLYNLFDIAQSRKAPIAVLGVTTRIDVAEALEKRVKSRFSHRYVHLSLAKSFAAFVNVCKSALCVHDESLKEEEKAALQASSSKASNSAAEAWNSMIESFLTSAEVDTLLRRIYYTTKSSSACLSSLLLPLATLPTSSTASTFDVLAHLTTNLQPSLLHPPDSKLSLLPSLSTLQLALLICAARQTAIHAIETVSFNLAYEEYKVLASKAKIQAAASGALGGGGRLWGKEVAREAWAGLIDVGFIMEDAYSGRGAGGGGRVDVGLEEIGESGVKLSGWGRWCREI